MDTEPNGATSRRRVILSASGAVAGFALFALFDVLPHLTEHPALLAALFTGVPAFFFTLLVCLGPLDMRRALAAAGTVALPVAALLAWASARFPDLDALSEAVHPFLAAGLMTMIATPFALNAYDPAARWNDYALLFRRSWEIVVRYVSAGIFAGVFWALYYLSSAILSLVKLPILETFVSIDAVPPTLTGAVVGLGLAVLYELRHLISPKIVLWLLRLLLPPLAVVSTVFLVLAPLNGMNSLLGDLSAGTTILAMSLALVTLVTITVDRSDDRTTGSPVLVSFARGGTVLVLLLSGLGLWAIAARVIQYGWTPQRVLAAVIGLVFLGYGLAYAGALLRGTGWKAALRRANIGLALGILALTMLWLTPVLNAERIAARSQVNRFLAGKIDAEAFDFERLALDWGVPGLRALNTLRASDAPQLAELEEKFDRLDAGEPLRRTTDFVGLTTEEVIDRLVATLPIRPEGAEAEMLIAGLPPHYLRVIDRACTEYRTPAGAPGCLGIVAPFDGVEDELMVFFMFAEGLRVLAREGAELTLDGDRPDPSLIDDLREGRFSFEPKAGVTLRFDGGLAAPRPAQDY